MKYSLHTTTIDDHDHDHHAVYAQLVLVSPSSRNSKTRGSNVPRCISLTKDKFALGRSADHADAVLDSDVHPRMISRHHCTIFRECKDMKDHMDMDMEHHDIITVEETTTATAATATNRSSNNNNENGGGESATVVAGESRDEVVVEEVQEEEQVASTSTATRRPRRHSSSVYYTYRIVDNKSLNGVYVNNDKVAQAHLRHGDYVIFGCGHNAALGATLVKDADLDEAGEEDGKQQEQQQEQQDNRSSSSIKRLQELILQKHGHNALIYRFDVLINDGRVGEDTMKEKRVQSETAGSREDDGNDNDNDDDDDDDVPDGIKRKLAQQVDNEPISKRQRIMIHNSSSSSAGGAAAAAAVETETPITTLLADATTTDSSSSSSSSLNTELQKLQELQEQIRREREELDRTRRELAELQQQSSSSTTATTSPPTVTSTPPPLPPPAAAAVAQQQVSVLGALTASDLEQEFVCCICQELIFNAATLQCSHTFCRGCINEWTRAKPECPTCRKRVLGPPMKNLTLDNIIDKYVKTRPLDEQDTWQQRLQEAKDAEMSALNDLLKSVATAKARGITFMDITRSWTAAEKDTFKKGIVRYSGVARLEYCKLTGLCTQFIDNSAAEKLLLACKNLDVEPATTRSGPQGRTLLDFETTRERLKAYIDGDTPM